MEEDGYLAGANVWQEDGGEDVKQLLCQIPGKFGIFNFILITLSTQKTLLIRQDKL